MFDLNGRPYIQGRLFLPRISVDGYIDFLVDTGADTTCLHPRDAKRLKTPFSKLRNPVSVDGAGGSNTYFLEPGLLTVDDGRYVRAYFMRVAIAEPIEGIERLSSVLGQNILRYWKMRHDPPSGRLEFTVKAADITKVGDANKWPYPNP